MWTHQTKVQTVMGHCDSCRAEWFISTLSWWMHLTCSLNIFFFFFFFFPNLRIYSLCLTRTDLQLFLSSAPSQNKMLWNAKRMENRSWQSLQTAGVREMFVGCRLTQFRARKAFWQGIKIANVTLIFPKYLHNPRIIIKKKTMSAWKGHMSLLLFIGCG